jgi:uncharacterized repeat protein (TIGR04052 family)
MRRRSSASLVTLFASIALASCAPGTAPFSLQFAASAGDEELTCTNSVSGLGANGDVTIGASDLRFYVSNLQLRDSSGNAVEHTLDTNDFQLTTQAGSVALIDLTSNAEGTCTSSSVAFAEGTQRTNRVLTGATRIDDVTSVSFDVGVPQALMKDVIATTSAEAAPSPMNEMFWSWASGYRHLVFNFAVTKTDNTNGDGYAHLGSRNCGPGDGLALEDRAACEFVNTPQVTIADFSLNTDIVELDVVSMLQDVDFVAPIYDPQTFEVIGEGPGVECHSSPDQPHCAPLFAKLGIDIETGAADATTNASFGKAAQ